MSQLLGSVLVILMASLFLVLAVAVMTATAEEMPLFKITTKRDNDRVAVKSDKDRTIFSVVSPHGISSATIERTGDKWPDAVVLRLHLDGLESFGASNGTFTLGVVVSSQDGKALITKDGKQGAALDAKSRYWTEIRMIGGDGKPTKAIPLKSGYFEMTLPKAFFEDNPKSITLNWIDFFRN